MFDITGDNRLVMSQETYKMRRTRKDHRKYLQKCKGFIERAMFYNIDKTIIDKFRKYHCGKSMTVEKAIEHGLQIDHAFMKMFDRKRVTNHLEQMMI